MNDFKRMFLDADSGGSNGGSEAATPATDGNSIDTPESDRGGAPETATPKQEPKEAPKTEPFKASEIKLPKGMEFDEGTGKQFEAFVEKHGLSADAAKEAAALYFKLIGDGTSKMDAAMKAAEDAQRKAWADEEKAWEDACKSDEEFGGTKWRATQNNVKAAIKALKADEFVKVMESVGLMGHPETVRMLNKIGVMVSEDRFGGFSSQHRKSDAEVFYGKG